MKYIALEEAFSVPDLADRQPTSVADKKLQWIYGTTRRWDGYLEFQRHPKPMLEWFAKHMYSKESWPSMNQFLQLQRILVPPGYRAFRSLAIRSR